MARKEVLPAKALFLAFKNDFYLRRIYIVKKGIDVSENNGYVDWQAVKDAGVDFAIIRLGYGNKHLDSRFEENIRGAREAGLDVGVYYYDYGLDAQDAREEADFLLDMLRIYGYTPWHLKLGIWFDMEDADNWKHDHGMPDNQTITDMCSEFICACNRNGYPCGIYASLDWLDNKIDISQYAPYVPYWVAQWSDECDFDDATIWQYTESLIIDGQIFDGNYLIKDC